MKKTIIFILSIFAIVSGVNAQTTGSPDAISVLNKTIDAIVKSKGIEAKFKVYNSGYSGSGTILSSGNKFQVKLPDAAVWYNGKDLYTYNSRTQETTVVTPTQEELAESNPLAYVTGATKNYSVAFSTVKKAGKYVLELLPKKKGDIKRITLTVNRANYVPEKIVVEPSTGSPITADISTFQTGKTLSQSSFEYPKSDYPKAEIVDLR